MTTAHAPRNGAFHYAAGLDIGNGYVKGIIGDAADINGPGSDVIDMPSAAATFTHPNQLPEPDGAARAITQTSGDGESDWFNNVDVAIASPLVADQFRRLIGSRGLVSGGNLTEFEMVGNKSKAEQELSKVLVLSIVAAKAVRDYVAATGSIPRPGVEGEPISLSATVTAALALPITEYMRHKTSYAAAFMGTRGGGEYGQAGRPAVHHVTVNNFETPVTVAVTFTDVVIGAEGASAFYAIVGHGEPLMDKMLADVRSRGAAGLDADITSADVLGARNVVGVDIGEGTVNFPVFSGVKFNSDASATLPQGYGWVLESALESMEASGVNHGFTGRKQLAEFLQDGPGRLRRGFYEKICEYVDRQTGFFVDAVAAEFGKVLASVGAMTEVTYVYGGGSGPVRDRLHTALEAKAQEMTTDDAFPVLYLDSAYSRDLNREGLAIAAANRAAKVRGAGQQADVNVKVTKAKKTA